MTTITSSPETPTEQVPVEGAPMSANEGTHVGLAVNLPPPKEGVLVIAQAWLFTHACSLSFHLVYFARALGLV